MTLQKYNVRASLRQRDLHKKKLHSLNMTLYNKRREEKLLQDTLTELVAILSAQESECHHLLTNINASKNKSCLNPLPNVLMSNREKLLMIKQTMNHYFILANDILISLEHIKKEKETIDTDISDYKCKIAKCDNIIKINRETLP